jgi:hypothetical protein
MIHHHLTYLPARHHFISALAHCRFLYWFSLAISPALLIESTLQCAFAPFLAYTQMLAEGKLDAYLDSVNPQDKIPVPGVVLSSDTHPLIYELGQHADMVWINKVFTSNNMFVVLEIANTAST